MRISMSPQDYATAFRLLSTTSRHAVDISAVIKQRVVPDLPGRPSLLDVGAGPGSIAERLAAHFSAITLIEPNREQLAGFKLEGAEIIHDQFENVTLSRQYGLVLCSHVMYHVPLEQWGAFVDRLLAAARPEGYCVIVLGAPRGQNYEMHREFTDFIIESSLLTKTLQEKRIPFDVAPTENSFTAATFDEMYALCRFFVLEDCYTREKLDALSEPEARELDAKIRAYAEVCRSADGTYRLQQGDDVIIINMKNIGKPSAS